jgi:methionine sulfoxide reductase heme-binding subunit
VNANSSLADPGQHAFWLASRGLGIVAMLLLSAAVGFGLALSGGMTHRPGGAAWLKTAHEALTLTALGAIAGHGLLLLGDPYLHPGLAGIAIPFALGSQPVWTGLGIVGGWLAAVLGLSYYVRSWIGVSTWRKLHRWTLLAWALALAHTIGSGTDSRSAWLVLLLAVSTTIVIVLGAKRASGRAGGPARVGTTLRTPAG